MNRNLRFALLAAAALAAVAPLLRGPVPAAAAPQEAAPAGTTFHFGTSEARTTVTFVSETSLETIHGICRAMSGTATLDFEKGEGATELRVPVKALDTGMESRNEHLRGDDWLEEAKHPEIVFAAKSLKRTKVDEAAKKETWAYEGELTIHGVTKALKGEATVQRIPSDIGKKLGAGEWVKVKTEFTVTLKDFKIEVPEHSAAKVSPTWDVKVDVFGTTSPPKKKG